MHRYLPFCRIVTLSLTAFLFVVGLATVSFAQVADDPQLAIPAVHPSKGKGNSGDDFHHPLGDQQRALRQRALAAKVRGQATGPVHQVARGQYVELEREGEDSIWTVIGEFGTTIHPLYGGTAGPLHNQIPQPDRNFDNATIWAPDFTRAYYENVLFSDAPGAITMRNFYIELSSNRYTVSGEVSDWVRVPFNEARYGTNLCGSNVCSTVWLFVRDSVNAWYTGQLAAGQTAAQINAYLAQFDVWDRYDYDGDGNFDEPDGYIDHFQSVHAGEGEETGGGAQGTDAIWSHRWYAFFNLIGSVGPAFNRAGGVQVGASDYWIGDYTIEPENGGVGVFAHEYAHDLDLPDLYDTSGGENSTGFWTLMSSGSYGNDGTVDLGSKPMHMGAWEKFQLGWLNYEVAFAGRRSEHKVGPAESNTKQAQGLFVVLPDKQVTTSLGAPYEGTHFYYSGRGDNLDNTMTRVFSLPAGAQLTAQVRYSIETDWDYAYLIASTDGGTTWTNVLTNLSTATNPNGQNFGNGITGSSGGNWVQLTADLSAYGGSSVVLGFRYWTDGFVQENGFMVDAIDFSGQPLDGAESSTGWTFDGFSISTGTILTSHFNSYVAEFRQYSGFDDSLRTGPYNFGFLDDPSRQDWVERFPYQSGLLISYWDSSQADNDTSQHPGEGLILPIDAHPQPLIRADGLVWRARHQSYDSPFGLDATDPITLHYRSQPTSHGGLPAVPVFDDRIQRWQAATPLAGVRNPNTSTIIEVRSYSALDTFMQVQVRPAR
jgi:immune inhibitor A